jgi:NADH-quinone oxidoreductase subunit C
MSDTTVDSGPAEVQEPELVHGAPTTTRLGQQVVFATREQYLDVMKGLRSDGFEMCVDLTGVDYLTHPERPELPAGIEPERFEVVVNLLSLSQRRRIRVRVQIPEQDPVCPSLFDLYPGTEAPEREVWDMLGISFDNHPHLTRILMPEDWEGHPLRKDFDTGRVPVQFKFPSEGRA